MKYTPIFVAHFYQDGTDALLCKADASCKHIRPSGHKMQRDVQRRKQRSNLAKWNVVNGFICHAHLKRIITNSRRTLSLFFFRILTRLSIHFSFFFLLSYFFSSFSTSRTHRVPLIHAINRSHSDKFMAFEKTFLVLYSNVNSMWRNEMEQKIF